MRDTPYLKGVGLPVFTGHAHPSASGRDVVAVDYDVPCNMAGVYLIPGDIILADDEGVLAMPLDLAEHVAAHGPAKERQEIWIRGKVEAGGSVHDYYPPNEEKAGGVRARNRADIPPLIGPHPRPLSIARRILLFRGLSAMERGSGGEECPRREMKQLG